MNRETGRKSFHGPSHDKMGTTKPKAPATWVDSKILFHNVIASRFLEGGFQLTSQGSQILHQTHLDIFQGLSRNPSRHAFGKSAPPLLGTFSLRFGKGHESNARAQTRHGNANANNVFSTIKKCES
jgi:hypothetical protein